MDNEHPEDTLETWRLILLVIYTLAILPVALIVAIGARVSGTKPARTTCTNCGYSMVSLETECPRCRATTEELR